MVDPRISTVQPINDSPKLRLNLLKEFASIDSSILWRCALDSPGSELHFSITKGELKGVSTANKAAESWCEFIHPSLIGFPVKKVT